MATISDVRVTHQFDGYYVASASLTNRLLAEFDGLNLSNSELFFRVFLRHDEGCSDLDDALFDGHTHNDRRFLVENSPLDHFKQAGEDRFRALFYFARILTLLEVFGELVEQMVNNLGREDLDLILLCKLLRFRHHSHIEAQHSCKLFVHFIPAARR